MAILGLLAAAAVVQVCGCSGSGTAPSPTPTPTPTPTASTKLVGYLPDYHSSYAGYAKTLDFSHMTHLILAFGLAKMCSGACTASSDMTISLRQNDADIATLVTAAHKAGVKVLISLGGGNNASDATISQFYLAGLTSQFAASIDQYVAAHNLDGVDVDIEDSSTMGAPYGAFVAALSARMHSESKLLTAAMAPGLQKAIPDAVLGECDFINVETYSTNAQAVSDLQFYAQTKSVAASKLVLGVPFFAQSGDQQTVESYAAVLAAYPNAWQTDQVSGGSLDGGITLYYVGEATMALETKLGAQYGGVMIWELTQDAAAPHSLMTVVQTNL